MLPLRVSFGSARLATRIATGVAGRALSLAGRTIGVVVPERPQPVPAAPSYERPAPAPRARPAMPPRQHAPASSHEAPPVTKVSSIDTPTPAASPEPTHVSEEPELVREEAEPGAEDGAGAAITVLEPWRGYAHMSAKDVISRARGANGAELAAVRLYESRHRSRQTVLAAVDRQLKLGNGRAPA